MNRPTLQQILGSRPIRNHVDDIASTLGFSLDVIPSDVTAESGLVCSSARCTSLRNLMPAWKARCEEVCPGKIAHAAANTAATLFTCFAQFISFAIPLEIGHDRLTVIGRGGFLSLRDQRKHRELVRSVAVRGICVSEPVSFISKKQAWAVCRYVEKSFRHLIDIAVESVSMRMKIEQMKEAFGQWEPATDNETEGIYRFLIERLFLLFDPGCITVLTRDRSSGRYVGLLSQKRRTEKALVQSIGADDVIVKELGEGKPYYLYQVPSAAGNEPTAWYFFPLQVNDGLEAILAFSDRVLKDDDVHILSTFCRQAAHLIENQRLQRELGKKIRRLAFAAGLPETISQNLNHRELMQAILDKSAELLMAERGSLMLLDEVTNRLLVEAIKGGAEIPEHFSIRPGEGIAGKVAAMGEPVLVRNLEEDPRFKQKNKGRYKTPSFVSVPLKIDNRIIGVLNLSDKTTGEVFDDDDLKLIQTFATHAAIVLDRNALYTQTEELKRLSITDPLTGLLNRRYLQDRLEDEAARAQRYDRQFCLLMIDLDGFKRFNDTRGHLEGDRVLKQIADVIMRSVRTMDVVARYGGDEFVVILPETGLDLATRIAERIHSDIATRTLFGEGGGLEGNGITASIGVIAYPQHGTTMAQLLEGADRAMYQAKRHGKNKIETL